MVGTGQRGAGPGNASGALEMGGESTTVHFVTGIHVMDTTLYIAKHVPNYFNKLKNLKRQQKWVVRVEQEDQQGATQTRRQTVGELETQLIKIL